MRFRLLPTRAPEFAVGAGMPWTPVFGLGIRDALGIDTDFAVPRLARSPKLGDTTRSDIPRPSRDDRDAWSQWWLHTLEMERNDQQGIQEDPLTQVANLTSWWSEVATSITEIVALWANDETRRFNEQMHEAIRSRDVELPERRIGARVAAETEGSRPLQATVAVMPLAATCWWEHGSIVVVDEHTRNSPEYEERLAQFLRGLLHGRGND